MIRLSTVLLLGASTLAPALTADTLRYLVAVGEQEQVVPSGSIEIHWHGWGTYRHFTAGLIRNGQLEVPDPVDALRVSLGDGYGAEVLESDPESVLASVDGWFVVIKAVMDDLPQPVHYRSDDFPIAGARRVSDLALQITGALPGVFREMAAAELEGDRLVLPPAVRRVIQFIDLEHRPVPEHGGFLMVLGTRNNRCATHQGIDLGYRITNSRGEMELTQPRETRLYYRNAYFLPTGGSYAGVEKHNIRFGTEIDHTDTVRGYFRADSRRLAITVLDTAGQPIPGAGLNFCVRTTGSASECPPRGACGAYCGEAAKANQDGLIELALEVKTRCVRGIRPPGGTLFPLDEETLERLYRTGAVTVTLPDDPAN